MKEKVLDLLEELCGTDEFRNDMDLDLFDNGLLDSLGFIELVIQIEQVLGIKLQPTEVSREDLATPNKIIEFLSQRG